MTYIYPETLWWDLRTLIEQNRAARERFVVVAPFASVGEPLVKVSKRRTRKDRFGNVVPYADRFEEDLVWATFLEACHRLGPQRVDVSRLSVVGYSMGGQASWNIALRYGSRLSAIVPLAGCCAWRRDAWGHAPEMVEELRQLPIRSYNGEEDTRSFSWRDLMWIAKFRGLSGKSTKRYEKHGDQVEVVVHEWDNGLQLHLVRGTETCHCCWDVIFHNEESFGLFGWLETLRCSTPSAAVEEAFSASRELKAKVCQMMDGSTASPRNCSSCTKCETQDHVSNNIVPCADDVAKKELSTLAGHENVDFASGRRPLCDC